MPFLPARRPRVSYRVDVPSPPRLRWTAALALAAHALVGAWALRAVPAGEVVDSSGPAAVAMETEVEVETPTAESAPASVESTADSILPAAAAHVDSRHPSAAVHGAPGAEAAVGAPAESSTPSASGGDWTFSPTGNSPTGTAPLSGNALNTAVRGGVDATLDADRKKDGARKPQLFPAFTPQDIELGLVPGSALVTMTRDRVRRSRVPTVSRALLEFDTDSAGIVASFHVLDSSQGHSEWNEVAAQIAADARAKPLRVPAGARGLAVTLEVTSALKTVDGATPTDSPLAKAWSAINDPIGAATRVPPVQVVAARIVDVKTF